MLPTREEAEELLREAEKCNPGPWGDHSRVAAYCAEKIARECPDLDPDKAYILGLLHDIGRKFGIRHLGHVTDGYSYMQSLGYDEAAKICLTHSFVNQTIDDYVGKKDTTEEEYQLLEDALKNVVMDEYDRLIQLCDSLAGAEGVLDIEVRMADVKRRYGSYPQEKWNRNLALKKHFEEKTGKDIYAVTGRFSINKIRIFNQKIETPSAEVYAQIKQNWDGVAKPLDGLGEFEHLLARIGAIGGSSRIDIGKKAIIAMCADNGVVSEGVSQSGQEVTAVVTSFMGQNRTSVGKMAGHIGAEVIPVDIGINGDDRFEGVLERKVRRGTRDFLVEPAMTEEEALQAIETGIELVGDCKKNGYRLLGTGEMGIGNTTTSSALAAVLLECPVEEVTGRGAGLSDEGLARKKDVIREALAKYQLGIYREQGANFAERKQDVAAQQEETLRALCCVGGLDIAGLVGVYIGGAVYHIPVVMDGLISMVAALAAERLVPGVKEYLIPSHMGKEPAARRLAEALGVRPVIHAGLALGEGTGAVMMFSLLDIALTLYAEQTTFSDISVEQYERFD